jgi:hypothetical protein
LLPVHEALCLILAAGDGRGLQIPKVFQKSKERPEPLYTSAKIDTVAYRSAAALSIRHRIGIDTVPYQKKVN